MTGIVLLPLSSSVRVTDALAAAETPRLCIADCYVAGVETWDAKPWGWQTELDGRTLLNIDHHAEDPRFYRPVSSGNLATDYVNQCGCLDSKTTVLINHTDCDSVISASILRGLLPPDWLFGNAVIAADHTGQPNPIADLLQALDPLRNFDFSFSNLRLLLDGQPLDSAAVERLDKRLADRGRALELVARGRFRTIGKVAVASLNAEEKLPGEFLSQALPDAWVIVVGSPMKDGQWENKVRLGPAAPVGTTLFGIGIGKLETQFGGRWNAGSTSRHGGSQRDPETLANAIAKRLTEPA
jgi:hypothetical protein